MLCKSFMGVNTSWPDIELRVAPLNEEGHELPADQLSLEGHGALRQGPRSLHRPLAPSRPPTTTGLPLCSRLRVYTVSCCNMFVWPVGGHRQSFLNERSHPIFVRVPRGARVINHVGDGTDHILLAALCVAWQHAEEALDRQHPPRYKYNIISPNIEYDNGNTKEGNCCPANRYAHKSGNRHPHRTALVVQRKQAWGYQRKNGLLNTGACKQCSEDKTECASLALPLW